MPNQKFTDKIGSQEATFKLTPKEYTSEEAYLKDHSDTFKEFLDFYEKNFTKADALRLLNRVEREIGDITAVADPENNKGKVSHVKADFTHAYVMEHLPFGYIGKTFEQKIGAKLYESDLIEALQDKFDLGDKYSNNGLGVIYKGKNAGELPEHVDIRDALDDHIWIPAINAGKKLLQDFVASKSKEIL